MSRLPPPSIIYLITSGKTQASTTDQTEEYRQVLRVVEAAVAAGIDLIQLREKELSDRELYSLASAAVSIARNSSTRVLVNDRADIAAAAGADGVHLTSQSLRPNVIKQNFGVDFLVGASTHSISQLSLAKEEGADFAVYGPVFKTKSKQGYGEPVGVQKLQEVSSAMAPFPVLALGGVELENAAECYRAGASGVAAIGLFDDPDRLSSIVEKLRTITGA